MFLRFEINETFLVAEEGSKRVWDRVPCVVFPSCQPKVENNTLIQV